LFPILIDLWNLKGVLEYSTVLSFDLCDGVRSTLTLLSDPGLELIVITQGCTFSVQTFIATERSLQVRLLFNFILTSLDKTNLKFFETIDITLK
jgi:hypothetical protein